MVTSCGNAIIASQRYWSLSWERTGLLLIFSHCHRPGQLCPISLKINTDLIGHRVSRKTCYQLPFPFYKKETLCDGVPLHTCQKEIPWLCGVPDSCSFASSDALLLFWFFPGWKISSMGKVLLHKQEQPNPISRIHIKSWTWHLSL